MRILQKSIEYRHVPATEVFVKYEYEHAAPAAGLSPELIRKAQQNSLEIAFLDPGEKITLQEKATGRVNNSDE